MTSKQLQIFSLTAALIAAMIIIAAIVVNAKKPNAESNADSTYAPDEYISADELVPDPSEEAVTDPSSDRETQDSTTQSDTDAAEQTEPDQSETLPPETTAPETVPPETQPPETRPPETQPPETRPPETQPPETSPSEPETFTTSKGFTGVVIDGVTYIDGYLIANKTYSLPQDYGDGLTKETQSSFDTMKAAAKKDGLTLKIVSGFRSYGRQKYIYNNYVKKDGVEKADTYSARPGHSEHQSGLAFDVNLADDPFIGTPEAIWLENNCYKYGFIIRYPQNKMDETGYQYEPWHMRYVGVELAAILYNDGDWITMEDYFGITSMYQ